MLKSGIQVLVAMVASGAWVIPTCRAQECGRPPLGNRIVGGTNAQEGAWPWQVDIQMGTNSHVCGGSIISSNWVLSAAHCFQKPSEVSSYTLYMGRYQLNGYNQFETSRSVRSVVIPNGYLTPQQGKDVALVQLSNPLSWTDRIQPICLPAAQLEFNSGTLCYVTGWGNIQEGVSLSGSGTLQEVRVPIIDGDSCNSMYQSQTFSSDILSDMICAGYKEGGKDSCQGDSGGPLVCSDSNGTWIQAGIVSFGNGCAKKNSPGVYAKVSSYTDFIRRSVPDAQVKDHACGPAPHSLLVLILSGTLVIWGR